MSGSVELSKDGAKDAAKDTVKPSPRSTARASVKSAAEPKPLETKSSADTLLKEAVTGAGDRPAVVPPSSGKAPLGSHAARYAAVAVGAMVVGTAFGMVAAPKPSSIDSIAGVQASLDASRAEAGRLNSEMEKLGRTITALRETTDATRAESRTLGASLYERLSALEHGLDKKLATVSETIEKTEREQTAKLAAQAEKRTATPAPAPAPVAAVTPPKSEPATTGSIAETKAKPETVETWAVRDVYSGIAILEDRRRRLVEVGPGDLVPGVGRVESVERRGRSWVVVTKQGLITPQSW